MVSLERQRNNLSLVIIKPGREYFRATVDKDNYNDLMYTALVESYGEVVSERRLDVLSDGRLRQDISLLRSALPEHLQIYSINRQGYVLYLNQDPGEEVTVMRKGVTYYTNQSDELNYTSQLLYRFIVSDKKLDQEKSIQLIARVKPRQELFLNILRRSYPYSVQDEMLMNFIWREKSGAKLFEWEETKKKIMHNQKTNLRGYKSHLNPLLHDYGYQIVREDAEPYRNKPGRYWIEKV